MSKEIIKTDVIIIEDDPKQLAYLTSFVRSLRIRIGRGNKISPDPKGFLTEAKARRQISARYGALAKNAGCFVLDIDLGPGARQAGIHLMSDIAQNAEVAIIVVTANRRTFSHALELDGLAPFLVIEKPVSGLPEEFGPRPSEDVDAFNDRLGQAIISACYVTSRLQALTEGSQGTRSEGQRDLASKILSLLQAHPTRCLLALLLVAVIFASWAIIALTHSHVF